MYFCKTEDFTLVAQRREHALNALEDEEVEERDHDLIGKIPKNLQLQRGFGDSETIQRDHYESGERGANDDHHAGPHDVLRGEAAHEVEDQRGRGRHQLVASMSQNMLENGAICAIQKRLVFPTRVAAAGSSARAAPSEEADDADEEVDQKDPDVRDDDGLVEIFRPLHGAEGVRRGEQRALRESESHKHLQNPRWMARNLQELHKPAAMPAITISPNDQCCLTLVQPLKSPTTLSSLWSRRSSSRAMPPATMIKIIARMEPPSPAAASLDTWCMSSSQPTGMRTSLAANEIRKIAKMLQIHNGFGHSQTPWFPASFR